MLNHIKFHKELLDSGSWYKMSALQQIGNLGSEVGRTINYLEQNDSQKFSESELRMFELFDMIMGDPKWKKKGTLREVCRLKEIIVDYIYGTNDYKTTKKWIDSYFFTISVAANEERKILRLKQNNG